MSDTFYPIRLNTLRSDEVIPFDVYVKLGQRFIHYSRSHDEMEGQRLKGLKSKGVRKLFIQSSDEDSYLEYLDQGINYLSDKSKDMNEKGALANDAMVLAAENAEKNLDTQEGFDHQKMQFDKITEFILSDRNAIKSMLTSAGISVDNNHHAATVSSLCLAVATKMGMTDKTELFELGTAALLHDIGKNRLKFDSHRSKDQMSPAEWKQFKEHANDGADMLAGKPYISPRILGLIQAHEEVGVGKGFPEKKNVFQLPLSYQILSMVNQFDHLATHSKLAPFQAMDPFFEKFGSDYDENLISVLATVIT